MLTTAYRIGAAILFVAYVFAALFLIQVCLAGGVLVIVGTAGIFGKVRDQIGGLAFLISGLTLLLSPLIALIGARYSLAAFANGDGRSILRAAAIGLCGSAIFFIANHVSPRIPGL
ncbi:MAG: hypothetical protein EOO77_28730 [Oxalobacteraceae bacterium]|uniref:hypothetical protein n=1 Tax=Sphingomonas faeni TaxID=185950 RepID=UPI0010DEA0BD|nr:hypothetical protein [Sphingomonas faeni]RYF05141.1 MAG: hypothetical protein EOO77_28730 [Oxalobacteraceae bacterium]